MNSGDEGKSSGPQLENGAPSAPDQEGVGFADEALEQRPKLSIRTRIILSFSLFFVLCLAISLWSLWAFSGLEGKIRFLEIASSYLTEIQQARRFEKNYLLYGTNLDDAMGHLAAAEEILAQNGPTMAAVLGSRHYETMVNHVNDYHALLLRLGKAEAGAARSEVETMLRDHGGMMVTFAQEFVEQEKRSVARLLRWAQKVPIFFLVVLMGLMISVALSLTRQLLGTLNRFMDYTQRIGQGDFSPIMPARRYQDEFTQLAEAFNRMISELDHRQDILVESHKLRAVGTLVAGVAHELNNPLNNIMLTVASLQDDYAELPEAEKQEMIQDTIDEVERCRRIVRDLLDFARQSEQKITPLQLDTIVADSIRLVANQVKIAKVKLETNFAENLPPIHGDEQMLKQVFVNLILNAVSVLPAGGRIWIRTRRGARAGFLAVEVRDNGPGIERHILPRLFEPFFTTKKQGRGTGLGLSVSRGIVQKLGGDIQVSSRVGQGTTFTVLLPTTEVPSDLSSG